MTKNLPALTSLQTVSLTAELTKELYAWTKYEKSPALGKFGAKTVGFIATPLTALIDAVVHAFLFTGIAITGLFVSAYNFIVKYINPKYKAPSDLEISAALVHLTRVVDWTFRAAILPWIMLLAPGKGYILSQEISEGNVKPVLDKYADSLDKLKKKEEEVTNLGKKIAELEVQKAEVGNTTEKFENLKEQYQAKVEAFAEANKQAQEANKKALDFENLVKDKETELATLTQALKSKEEEYQKILLEKSSDGTLIQQKDALVNDLNIIKTQIVLFHNQLKEAQAKLDQANAHNIDLQNAIVKQKQLYDENLIASNEKIDSLNQKLTQITQTENESKKKLSDVDVITTNLQEQVAKKADELAHAKQELSKELESHNKDVVLLNKKLEEKNSELQELQKSQKQFEAGIQELSKLKEQITQKEKECVDLSSSLASHKKEADAKIHLIEENIQVHKEYNQAKHELEKNQAELNTLKEQLEKLKHNNDALIKENNDEKKNIKEKEAHIEELETKNSTLNTALEKFKQQMSKLALDSTKSATSATEPEKKTDSANDNPNQ